MSCTTDLLAIEDIEPVLEGYIVDWMLDVKNNLGLMKNVEEIYPESTIISNNATAKTNLFAMADEMSRIKTTAKSLYATISADRALVDAKITALCARKATHEANRDAWITYKNSDDLALDVPGQLNAQNQADSNQALADARQAEADALSAAANVIIGEINTEFIELRRGVLKARYLCNKSVGTYIDENLSNSPDANFLPTDATTTYAYVLKVLSKIGKWADFAQDLEITNKLKSVTFNTTVHAGTGSYSSVISALSARDAVFNDDGELEVSSEMEYKAPIVAAYGPQMISAISSSKDDIVAEESFLDDLLISRVTNQIVTYNATNGEFATPSAATFENATWYEGKSQDLDDEQAAYDPTDDTLNPAP